MANITPLSTSTDSSTTVPNSHRDNSLPAKIRKMYYDGLEGQSRVPIWHQEIRATRRQVVKEWLKTTSIICLFILAVLSLFTGAFFHVRQNLSVLNVWVVSFDDGSDAIIGPNVVEIARKYTAAPGHHITISILPSSRFEDHLAVRRGVYDEHAWAVISVLPDASARLRNAVAIGNTSYDPTEACETVYVGARDPTTISSYLEPPLMSVELAAQKAVARAWIQELTANASLTTTALGRVPQAVSPAIGFKQVDLRPFSPPQVTPWTSVCLIYLIIVAFFSYTFFMPTHTHFINEMEGHRKILFHHLVIWKYVSTTGAYFFMSLAYSLVPLMFQIPMDLHHAPSDQPVVHANAYGRGTFPVYWMVNFVGMCALGGACENVAMFIGQPWTALWLIFWVISNVSTAFYPIVLAPGIYQYGYAFPLNSVVNASRTLLFDVHSTIGLDLGVLLSWWAVNTALFPFAAWWLRHVHYCKGEARVAPKKDDEKVGEV